MNALVLGGDALPAGVIFVDDDDRTAVLICTPAAGTSGTYPLTVTAANRSRTDRAALA